MTSNAPLTTQKHIHDSLLNVKNFLEIRSDWTRVCVGWHDIAHEFPPLPANIRVCNGGPSLLRLDFCISKQLSRLWKQKYRVICHAMIFESLLELGPNGIVSSLILDF